MPIMLIHNALINGTERGWVAVEPPFIARVGLGEAPQVEVDSADEVVDAQGALLLPGAIDAHVHFREPGLTHKASIASESRAALAGGVTSIIEMPNTKPPTVTIDDWRDKMDRAAARSAVNYAFMMGATADNLAELRRADPSMMPAVKVFMGSSTGNMLLDDDSALRAVFADQPFPIVVHAEDQSIVRNNEIIFRNRPGDIALHNLIRPAEACVRATERSMELAIRYNARLHVAHVTTEAETRLFEPSQSPDGKQITGEVSPHHLTFTADDYPRLGARIKMNPSVKSAADRDALRQAVADGRLDIIATDHAPHLLSEKEGDVWHAVSGAPMVQFSMPLMLDMFGPELTVARMCKGPAIAFGIDRRGSIAPGYYADLVLAERLTSPRIVSDDDVVSLCAWTPLAGHPLSHRIIRAWVNGGDAAMPLQFARIS